jgi:SAM-dependent methyltransferase
MLARFGLRAIGLDLSAVMLDAARDRATTAGAPLLRAAGDRLPLADECLAGCRTERVLMHVADPEAVLAEVVRCVRPGGLSIVFEPDWAAFRVTSDVLPEQAAWLTSVAHPDIAGRLWELLELLGCQVLDRVEELSVWRSLSTLKRVTGFPASVDVPRRRTGRPCRSRGMDPRAARPRVRGGLSRPHAEGARCRWTPLNRKRSGGSLKCSAKKRSAYRR